MRPGSMNISYLDFAILVLYLIGITAFGARFRKGQQNLEDYFLGGRTAPWWALACSIVATETSTLTIISTPGIAYARQPRISAAGAGLRGGAGPSLSGSRPAIFQRRILYCLPASGKALRAAHEIGRRSGVLGTRALAEGVRIAAIGKVVSVAFGTGDRSSIVIITVLTMFYTFEGGMRAVIWTDVIQFILYILGSLGAFFLLLHKIPGGWPEITQVAAASGGKLQIFDFAFSLTKSFTFWSGLIGGTFLTMASHGTDQTMVQRLLSARNERDAKKALLTSGVIVFFQFALFLLIGVMLYVYGLHETLVVPDGDLDRIYPWFIVHRMPVVAVGLLLASIFAIAMSNASGSLNSLASSSIIDLGRRRPDDASALKRSRVTTLLLGPRARRARLGALGPGAGGRPHHRGDHLRRDAWRFPARHLESAR